MSAEVPRLPPASSSFGASSGAGFSQRDVSIPPWDTLQDLTSPSEASSGDEVDELAGTGDSLRQFLPQPTRPTSSTTSQPRKSLSHLRPLSFPVMPPTNSNATTSKNAPKPSSSSGAPKVPPAQTDPLFLPSGSPPVATTAPRTTIRKVADVRTPSAKKVQTATANSNDTRRPSSSLSFFPQIPRPLKRKEGSRAGVDTDTSIGASTSSGVGAGSGLAALGNVANKRARYEGLVPPGAFSRDRIQDNQPASATSSKHGTSSTSSSAIRSVSSPSRSTPSSSQAQGPSTSSASTSTSRISSGSSPFFKPKLSKPSSSSLTSTSPSGPSSTSAIKPRTSLDSSSSRPPSSASSPSRPSTSSATASGTMGPPRTIPPRPKLVSSRTFPSTSNPPQPKAKSRPSQRVDSMVLKPITTNPPEVIELFDSDSDTDKPKPPVKPKPRKPSPKPSYKLIQEGDCIVITDESEDEAETSAMAKGKEREQAEDMEKATQQMKDKGKAKEVSMMEGDEPEAEVPSAPQTPSASPANTNWPGSRIAKVLANHTFSPLQIPESTGPTPSKAKDVVMASPSSPTRPRDEGQPVLLPAAPIVASSSKNRIDASSGSDMDVDPRPKAIPPIPSPRREFLRKPREDEMDVDDSGDDVPVFSSPQKPSNPVAVFKPRILPAKPASSSTPSKAQLPPSSLPSVTPIKKQTPTRPQPTPPSSDAEDSEVDRLKAVLKERPVLVKSPARKTVKHKHTKSLSSSFFGDDDAPKPSTSTTNTTPKGASTSAAPQPARVTSPNRRDMSRTARKTMINPNVHSRNSSTSAAVADAIAHQGNNRPKPDVKPAARTTASTSKAGGPSTTPVMDVIDLTLDDSDEELANAKTTTPQTVSPTRKPTSAAKPRPPPLPVGTTLGSLGGKIASPLVASATTSPGNLPGTPPPLSSAVPSGTASPEQPESNQVRRRSAPLLPPPPPPQVAAGTAASPPRASNASSPPAFQALLGGLRVHDTAHTPVSPGGALSEFLGSRRSPTSEVEETDAAVDTDGGKPSGISDNDNDASHGDHDDEPLPSAEEQEVQAFLEVDSEVPPTDSEMDLDHPLQFSAKEKGKGRAVPVDLPLPESRPSSPNEDGPSTRRITRSQAFGHGQSSASTSSGVVDPSHLFDRDDGVQDAATLPSEPAKPLTDATNHQRRAVVPPKTYGGYTALTWSSFRSDLRNFQPAVKWSKDINRDLHDAINSYTPYARGHPQIRNVFEGMMQHNTSFDEPDAPPIKIINDIDGEPNPPWEFYYTNEMYLAPDVPPPDLENLVGCDCIGGCDPKINKHCACVQKNQDVFSSENMDFLYDKNGKLKMPGFPIYECNDLCSCSDECRNRVVQHGRKVPVSIKKTKNKGWGIFAGGKKIPKGTFIGIYSGELITEEAADERGVNYDRFGKTYLFDLDFHHLRTVEPNWKSKLTVDAYHVGNFTRFLNHSCDPNCRLYPCYVNEGNKDKPMLTIFAIRDIEPEEEICFNYQGKYPGDEPEEDNQEEDEDEHDKSAEKVHERCRCEAPNCTGIMFGR